MTVIRGRHSVAFADFHIKDTKSSFKVSCTVLYTITHLFAGLVVPLSDSFVINKGPDEKDHKYYQEVFLMIQYISAIGLIFYLQLYIFVCERKMKRACRSDDVNELKEIADDFAIKCQTVTVSQVRFHNIKNSITNSDVSPQTSRATTGEYIDYDQTPKVSDGLITNKVKEEEEGEEEDSAFVDKPDLPNPDNDCCNEFNENVNDYSETRLRLQTDKSSKSSNEASDSECSTDDEIENESFPFVRDSEGINLYLRLGAVGFGFGVMVHDGFKIADQIRLKDVVCHNILWTPKQCLHLAYIFIQTFFIFKYHRIIFLSQRAIIRLILWHITIINICQWFKTVVYEINHEVREGSHSKEITTYYRAPEKNLTCADQLSYKVSPYLFPCAIEYSLICAAITYKMLQKVGRDPHKNLNVQQAAKCDTHSKSSKNPYNNKDIEAATSSFNTIELPPTHIKYSERYSECHRSHKGLFLGLFFFMATLVGLAVFLIFRQKHHTENLAVMVYQITEIILLNVSLIALVLAFIKMRVLSFRQLTGEEALDDNLLLIGFSGVFSYNLFLFISIVSSMNDLTRLYLTKILFLCKSTSEMIQSLLQVLFVLEASRKFSKLNVHVQKKPGRAYVTFLIITNLALWVVSIFETKRADQHFIFTEYYNKTPWSIITHTLLPLIIFFRFHSTVCMTDIWIQSYKKKFNARAVKAIL